jgi:hypothetical protein
MIEHIDIATIVKKLSKPINKRIKLCSGRFEFVRRYFQTGLLHFKCKYFASQIQPFQFILCGVIQVILDAFVIIQIFWYRRAKYNDEDK